MSPARAPVGAVVGEEGLRDSHAVEWFRQDLERFAGNPAGPHCSDPKWTSQELTNFVRRWGDPSPWGARSQSNQTLPFSKEEMGYITRWLGRLVPRSQLCFETAPPSTLPQPTLRYSYFRLFCLWLPLSTSSGRYTLVNRKRQ